MKISIVSIMLCLLMQPVFALADKPKDMIKDTEIPTSYQKEIENKTLQIELLKKEVEIGRSYENSLTTTVFWSLGGIVSLGLVLIGYSWFANFKVYERDKLAMSSELKALFSNEKIKLNEEVRALSDANKKEFSNSIPAAVKIETDKLSKALLGRIDKLQYEVVSLEYDVLEQERMNWCTQEVYVNALMVSVEMLNKAIKEGKDKFWVSRAIDFVQEDISELVTKKRSLESHAISDVIQAIDKLGQEHTIVATNIKEKLAKLSK